MNFGEIFRYVCKFNNGEVRVWRVLATSRKEADIKLNDFVNQCATNGNDVPVNIEFTSHEDNLILY